MEEQAVKDLVDKWYQSRGKNETDPFYRFLCLWICFNAWLDFRANQVNDRQMIDWLKQQDETTSEIILAYENMTKTTSGAQSLQNLATASPIRDPKGGRPDILVDPNDRESVIEGIYRIRCNLFHGGKSSSDLRDEKLVNYADAVLNKWLSELLAVW
jgi:hypothetical protein